MSVTFEEKAEYVSSRAKCFNLSCAENKNTSGHGVDNKCGYTVNTGKCKNFQCEKSEKHQIKYEIVKPFSIIDIYEKNPCSGEYAALLRQNSDRNIDAKWKHFEYIEKSKVLMRNLAWLKENGFIVEKKDKYPWVNVYLNKNKTPYFGNNDFETEKEAKKMATLGDDYVTPIRLKPAYLE